MSIMQINAKPYRTIWHHPSQPNCLQIIDQRWLPHRLVIENLNTLEDAATAIRDMHVRGAPLIGSAAAYGMYLAVVNASPQSDWLKLLESSAKTLLATRPTAVNLAFAINKVMETASHFTEKEGLVRAVLKVANEITEESVAQCRSIGEHGLGIIEDILKKKQKGKKTINILTHCNAGWLACIDYGTATAPVYLAHDQGIDVHVWVDETRPRNQGARITAYELLQHGVPHTVITDNAGGHLMQHGLVDLVIVGTDRTARTGDVANKVGTYLKALAAHDNGIPFYVAAPSSSIDWNIRDGLAEIPIEERDVEEVRTIQGWDGKEIRQVLLTPQDSPAANFAFDVTPARLISGLITERGVCGAKEEDLMALFPEFKE